MKNLMIVFFISMPALGLEFQKRDVKVGKKVLKVEIADTSVKREQGLMYRNQLRDDEGMLFVFPSETQLSFWMKNTNIPLSIGFFNSKKKLFQILPMDPANPMELQPKTYISAKPAQYALEVPIGWFDRHKVKLGDELKY